MVNFNTVIYIFVMLSKHKGLIFKDRNLNPFWLKNTDLSCKWSLIVSMLIFPVVQSNTILYLLNCDFIFLLVFSSASWKDSIFFKIELVINTEYEFSL